MQGYVSQEDSSTKENGGELLAGGGGALIKIKRPLPQQRRLPLFNKEQWKVRHQGCAPFPPLPFFQLFFVVGWREAAHFSPGGGGSTRQKKKRRCGFSYRIVDEIALDMRERKAFSAYICAVI